MRIVVIIVFLDEGPHPPELPLSVGAQMRACDHVHLVDDGSRDSLRHRSAGLTT